MISCRLLVAVHALSFAVQATPSPFPKKRITPLSTSEIDAYTPYTWFASAAYCLPSATSTWSCGANCDANPGFMPVASGGDGDSTQFWYVGYDSVLDEVVVAHQGTDTSKLLPDLEDATIVMLPLDPRLFPGLSPLIDVHSGFGHAQAQTATAVLAAVRRAMSKYGTSKVTVVGHSLGGAIALLDSVYLPLHLPPTTTFKTITYGLPRVGNQAFADYVDSTNGHLAHINNKEDPIPTLPSLLLGYRHPSGEIHIQDNDAWDACPGQDNPSTLCSTGDVPTVLQGDEPEHDGPYNGITITC